MKTLKVLCWMASIYMIASEVNFSLAENEIYKSEGTDLAIETALLRHGFTKEWSEEITFLDKQKALVNIIKNN